MKHNYIYFLILHYGNANVTIECVESILKLHCQEEVKIVMVDNASNNRSYEVLKEKYELGEKCKILRINEGKGFSYGNNYGYEYIAKQGDAKLIVVCNNDIVFVQKNFIDELLKLYEVSQFYIAGPDIYNTAENIHQNPFDYKIATLDYVEKRIKNVKTELNNLDLYMKKDLFIKKISDLCIYKLIHRARHKQETRQMETVCIHGACIIVSEKFIAQSEGLFVPETKFYCEEEILSYRCYKKGWKIIYSPAIIVEHRESVATSEKYSNYRSRREFMLKSTLDSLQILKNYVINTR